MAGLHRTPIHRAANRYNLFLGGDRELVMLTGMASAVMVLLIHNLPAVVLGVLLWVGGLFALRRMGKNDPMLRQVYWRSYDRYRHFYPPRGTPFMQNRKSHQP